MEGVLEILQYIELKIPKESFRLQIKELAENERMKFARKGLSEGRLRKSDQHIDYGRLSRSVRT